MTGWLILTLPGREDPLILQCLSAHHLPPAQGVSNPPYEFITRRPPGEDMLFVSLGQPMEFLLQADKKQLRGELLLKQVAPDGGRLRLETVGEVVEGL